jgi:hypothetical protein
VNIEKNLFPSEREMGDGRNIAAIGSFRIRWLFRLSPISYPVVAAKRSAHLFALASK